VLHVATRILNPIILKLAGSRYLPFFAVVYHVGRRSGRRYATPTNARRTADGFMVPLTFGEGSDWFRNVQAAGGCVIRWKGIDYPVVAPELVDRATAQAAFAPLERLLIPLIGVKQFVRLRSAPVDDARGTASV
jgi:deazaflavin-dependent oxidoreductase (nitroreductase family)